MRSSPTATSPACASTSTAQGDLNRVCPQADAGIDLSCEGPWLVDPPGTPPPAVQGRFNDYTMEVVQQIGSDSFVPGHGVLIGKSKTGSSTCGTYSCFIWYIDSNPQDIDQVDFVRPDGTVAEGHAGRRAPAQRRLASTSASTPAASTSTSPRPTSCTSTSSTSAPTRRASCATRSACARPSARARRRAAWSSAGPSPAPPRATRPARSRSRTRARRRRRRPTRTRRTPRRTWTATSTACRRRRPPPGGRRT